MLELQERAKLGAKGRPSDEVEGVKFSVKWEPQGGTLGVPINPLYARVADGELAVVSLPLVIRSRPSGYSMLMTARMLTGRG